MPSPAITISSWENLEPASNLLGRVFDRDPVLRFMLCDLSDEQYNEYLQPYWRGLCRTALLNRALILEAAGLKSVAVILPPGRAVYSLWTIVPAAFGFTGVLWRIGISGCIRMLGDYSRPVNAAKRRVLGNRQYYYVFAIGTEYEHQGKGLARAVLESQKETARCSEVPIWLEATTEYSRNLYLSLGFEEVEQITIGQGRVNEDGFLQKDGQGVTLWAMVWWPQSSQRDVVTVV
ncbi:hypothetical protein BDW66DRAFT_157741 [Aspergillus desertorum]